MQSLERASGVAREKAILVRVVLNQESLSEQPLAELSGLAETAGAKIVGELMQRREQPDVTTYLGRGKVAELKALAEHLNADIAIFDNDLNPAQIRNLETALDIKVLDRTELILDIFATNARSSESRLAVELAQLEYSLPRLKRMWTHLSQIKAGIGPFLVNTHHLSDVVRRHVEESPFRSQITVVHEEHLLGTGGTLLANRSFFSGEPILLAHADNLCVCDFQGFVRAHEQRPPGTVITMMTFTTDNPQSCGILELDDHGVVVGFHEKVPNPPGNLANGAVYLIEPEVIADIADLQKPIIDFSTEVVPRFVGRINTWHNAGILRDIGSASSLRAAQLEEI